MTHARTLPHCAGWPQNMRRRDLALVLAGIAVALPRRVLAEQPVAPVIGYLAAGSPASASTNRYVAAFRQGLAKSGYVEGQNVAVEYRWADGDVDRLPALAADLVDRHVAVILANGTPAALAAKVATSTIPIVFNVGVDPVQFGFVAGFNRPGTNMTGVVILDVELVAKRLELLHEVMPGTTAIALLVNPTNPITDPETREAGDAARSLGIRLHVLRAGTASAIDTAFRTAVELRAGALVVGSDTLFNAQTDHLVALATRHALPAIYAYSDFALAGGLMSYGTDFADTYRQQGDYTGRILIGARPSDLPVGRPTRFQLVINLKAAKTLGLALPAFLARADEVIE
jgi:putative ABC transport system substrate-binding protein